MEATHTNNVKESSLENRESKGATYVRHSLGGKWQGGEGDNDELDDDCTR